MPSPSPDAATGPDPKIRGEAGGQKPPAARVCGKAVYWWDGEYEGECELPKGHGGDHFDGLSWFNDDGEDRTDAR